MKYRCIKNVQMRFCIHPLNSVTSFISERWNAYHDISVETMFSRYVEHDSHCYDFQLLLDIINIRYLINCMISNNL